MTDAASRAASTGMIDLPGYRATECLHAGTHFATYRGIQIGRAHV